MCVFAPRIRSYVVTCSPPSASTFFLLPTWRLSKSTDRNIALYFSNCIGYVWGVRRVKRPRAISRTPVSRCDNNLSMFVSDQCWSLCYTLSDGEDNNLSKASARTVSPATSHNVNRVFLYHSVSPQGCWTDWRWGHSFIIYSLCILTSCEIRHPGSGNESTPFPVARSCGIPPAQDESNIQQ